jgi:C-terminal processing protease CtpA/Prc
VIRPNLVGTARDAGNVAAVFEFQREGRLISGRLGQRKCFAQEVRLLVIETLRNKSRYHGKTVMLVDERTISQAEHTGLFLEAANGTKFIGSPTQGANGDVTNLSVPGGIYVRFSGQGVWHADGRQLQRLGLQPTVEVRPTLLGIRAGKDEVLEVAIEYLKHVPQ